MRKILAAGIMLCCSTAMAALPSSGSFWDKSAEGYWWYAQDPLPPKKPEPKKEKPAIAQNKPNKQQNKEPAAVASAPPVFSADWVEENLKVYRRVAWDNPTVENLRAYLYLPLFAAFCLGSL